MTLSFHFVWWEEGKYLLLQCTIKVVQKFN